MNTYKPLPGVPAFAQYDQCLTLVKEQCDIMRRQHPLAALQWLNEVQSLLNRMRDALQDEQFNQMSPFRTEGCGDE